jgi:hypothetical protein
MKSTKWEFTAISKYNYPQWGDIGFMGDLGSQLPKSIEDAQVAEDDMIVEGDSDDEKIKQIEVESTNALLSKIE